MFEKVCKVLAEFCNVSDEDMSAESDILNDLGINSLDIVCAVMRFEEEFNVAIPDRSILNFHTVGDIVEYLSK